MIADELRYIKNQALAAFHMFGQTAFGVILSGTYLVDFHPLEACAETARVTAWTNNINLLHNGKEIKMGIEPSETPICCPDAQLGIQ